ncbi:MAG: tRNA uridine-5-carboxymethylaminomethyl(34) synthesis GTPase MnmE [Acutalibacteraceae bacterium]
MSTVAAISTAYGVGGIGVIRISGEDSLAIADKVFEPYAGEKGNCLKNLGGYRAKYGKIIQNNEPIDDAVALVFRAPHSYTGEDVVEISCHGGIYITKKVLRAILDAGAVPAEPGEFTKRAFLNGKMDLSQSEAVMDLISAKGERANKIAFRMKEGYSSEKIAEIKDKITDITAALSVWADYPEDDIPQVDEKMLKNNISEITYILEEMIKNYDMFKAVKEGIKIAIVGRPNVGKSTLMNCLSGSQKSIVTDIPGTTRDAIEESIMIGDIPVILVDTAGIRKTDDTVEKIGVEKAKTHMKNSEITLVVLDASAELSQQDKEILDSIDSSKSIILLNKCDEIKKINAADLSTYKTEIVELSALKKTGMEKLKKCVENLVGVSKLDPSDVVISNERQLAALKNAETVLKKAIEELKLGITLDAVTVLLQDALEKFMEFTGETVSEAVVNKVFSKFCVGK